VNGSRVTQYFYDAYGRRVKIVEGDTTTITLYSRNDIVYEVKANPGQPTVTTRYLAINGKYLAKVVQEGTNQPQTYFYHVDLVGSVRAITDGQGQVVARFGYEPFGVTVQASGSLAGDEVHKFTGKPEDVAIGLYYFNTRFYDPTVGRFTSQDPKKDAINWYAYPRWNPLVMSDPTGEWGKRDHSGLTDALAQRAGFSDRAARILGVGSAYPDELASGICPVPIIGDPSWHFNQNRPGLPDSRLEHFVESKDQALDLAKQGKWEEALFTFGKGLHALQDYYAHGDETPLSHFVGDVAETITKFALERKVAPYFWRDDPMMELPFLPVNSSASLDGWRPLTRWEMASFFALQELLEFRRELERLGCAPVYFD
jgi:RHS repeat-associated protein